MNMNITKPETVLRKSDTSPLLEGARAAGAGDAPGAQLKRSYATFP